LIEQVDYQTTCSQEEVLDDCSKEALGDRSEVGEDAFSDVGGVCDVCHVVCY
jgi:hypothetical protein